MKRQQCTMRARQSTPLARSALDAELLYVTRCATCTVQQTYFNSHSAALGHTVWAPRAVARVPLTDASASRTTANRGGHRGTLTYLRRDVVNTGLKRRGRLRRLGDVWLRDGLTDGADGPGLARAQDLQ